MFYEKINNISYVNRSSESSSSASSGYFTPSSGVPQGAILSTPIFSLFVYSASSVLDHANLLIFDMKIFFPNQIRLRHSQLLQNDLQRFSSVTRRLFGTCSQISPNALYWLFATLMSQLFILYSVNNTISKISNNFVQDLGFTLFRDLCPNLCISR